MTINRKAKGTLTPVELDHQDNVRFELTSGAVAEFVLLDTGYRVVSSDLESFDCPVEGAKTVYRFWCDVLVDGEKHRLEREVPTQKSFYQPWVIAGVRIWLDAVSDPFASDGGFLLEKDESIGIRCCPGKKARLALQDAAVSICPEKLHPIMPLPKDGLDIRGCYRGEDCWMGTYKGKFAHGGLDINHPKGLPLRAPFDLDDQHYFNSVSAGDKNNRWRGVRAWEDGSAWVIQAHHMTALTVPERTPVKRGVQFASGAGVLSGVADHSHFVFRVVEDGREYLLDPWILFWQMYRDAR